MSTEKSSAPDDFFPDVLRRAVALDRKWQETFDAEAVSGQTDSAFQKALGQYRTELNARFADAPDITSTLEKLAEGKDFAAFKECVERVHYGFVFTAHPTFTLTREGAHALMQGKLKQITCNDTPPDLDHEMAFSLDAIDTLQDTLLDVYEKIFAFAAEKWPKEDLSNLTPVLFTIASWVGFDLDGRSDIGWADTLGKRFEIQARQLKRYEKLFADVDEKAVTLCRDSAEKYEAYRAFFAAYEPKADKDGKALQEMSRRIVSENQDRLTRIDPLLERIETVQSDKNMRCFALRALLCNLGLSSAHIHFRLNATPVHNAVRKQVDLTTDPEDRRSRQGYFDRIQEMIASAKPVDVHLGDIRIEQTSCKRLFMLMQFILRHIDGDAPIRFLIAETESAFTVLTALYFARLFGVADDIDICPLIETEEALRRGSRLIEQALDVSPHFADALKKRRRLAIQTGYSDAGRYIGQLPACGSIERLKERMITLFQSRDDLKGIDLLFFDTHGESIGRGRHPGTILDRIQYMTAPTVIHQLHDAEINYIQEDSWQGGDGYTPLLSTENCRAVMCTALTYLNLIDTDHGDQNDPYYDPLRRDVTEFLTTISTFQGALIDNPDYGAMLSAFGPALIPAMGSRSLKRQSTDSASVVDLPAAASFRAIPHNAILTQLGYYANILSGAGQAIQNDPYRFSVMKSSSPRFKHLLALLDAAEKISSRTILKSYLILYDPGFWLALGAREESSSTQKIVSVLHRLGFHAAFTRIYNHLSADDIARSKTSDTHPLEDKIAELHATRLALMMRIMRLAVSIPGFSPQHMQKRDDLIALLFRLQVPQVVEHLHEIFPAGRLAVNDCDYGEPSSYHDSDRDTYAIEAREIFEPLTHAYTECRKVSHTLAKIYGYCG